MKCSVSIFRDRVITLSITLIETDKHIIRIFASFQVRQFNEIVQKIAFTGRFIVEKLSKSPTRMSSICFLNFWVILWFDKHQSSDRTWH